MINLVSQFKYGSFLKDTIDQYLKMKPYFFVILSYLIISYGLYFVLCDDAVIEMGFEDGPYEYFTALFFLVASFFFTRNYFLKRNIFSLLLAIIFFVGCGEEISWGQRILNFNTPEIILERNVQEEFTLHNLEIFNDRDFDYNQKKGLIKLPSINFLYKLFWLSFGIIVPMLVLLLSPIKSLAEKIKLPIVPLALGLFFLVNWVLFKLISTFFLPLGKPREYYYSLGEIRESGSALIFMLISIYHYYQTKKAKSDVAIS